MTSLQLCVLQCFLSWKCLLLKFFLLCTIDLPHALQSSGLRTCPTSLYWLQLYIHPYISGAHFSLQTTRPFKKFYLFFYFISDMIKRSRHTLVCNLFLIRCLDSLLYEWHAVRLWKQCNSLMAAPVHTMWLLLCGPPQKSLWINNESMETIS